MTERRPAMDPADYQLSMAISPRAKRPEDNDGLRTLLVLRLSDTTKAVARLGLNSGKLSIHCEPCRRWHNLGNGLFPQEWRCPQCERLYAMEFAVLEEVNE